MPKEITNTALSMQLRTFSNMLLVWVVLCVFVVSSTGLLPDVLFDLNMDQLELVENGENESESDHNESKLEKDKDNFIQSSTSIADSRLNKLLEKNTGIMYWEHRHQDISTPPPERF